jgi:hypothetical protein
MAKKLGVWPLPGGVTAYFTTALAWLEFIRDQRPADPTMRAFMRERYEVTGSVSAKGYLDVLRNLGWTALTSEGWRVTPRGEEILSTRSKDLAWLDLTEKFAGFDETLAILQRGPIAMNALKDELNRALNTTWEKSSQAAFRANWLRSLGRIADPSSPQDDLEGDTLAAAFAAFRARGPLSEGDATPAELRAGMARLDLAIEDDENPKSMLDALTRDLDARDEAEVRAFLRAVATGGLDDRLDAEHAEPPSPGEVQTMLKVAPGEGARYWHDCLANGVMVVGWDDVGDLRAHPSRESFERAFEETYSARYQGNRTRIVRAARKLWLLRDLRAGDVIVANRGIREVLGIGVVVVPGYIFDAARPNYRHTVKVRWDTSRASIIEDQGNWRETIVRLDPGDWGQLLGGTVDPPPPVADPPPPPPPALEVVHQRLTESALRVDRRMLRRYLAALESRRFVVLAGQSGTGKTWLAREVALALGARCCVVPVAPNWTANEDLLGFRHPISGAYVDTELSAFLREASRDWEQRERKPPRKWHVVLDEMNLARVEHYFSRMLSTLEQSWQTTESVAMLTLAPGDAITLGPNLYFIGTVNVDETTHTLADKVLDRAQVIELSITRTQVVEHLARHACADRLLAVWDAVHTIAPFAFRALDDITEYIQEGVAHGAPWQESLDEQVLQKVLVRVRGASPAVGEALRGLVAACGDELPLTRERASRMLEAFARDGVASFF